MHMSGALSLDASGEFSGNDGKWSTFPFHIGTPPQVVNLIPSTSGQETWVIAPQACTNDDSICQNKRGRLFDWSTSNTWSTQGTFNLNWKDGDELNLSSTRLDPQGYFGFETIATGWPGDDSAQVNHSVIAGTSSGTYIGQIGLSPRPTNFTNSTHPQTSFLSLLQESQHISSLSYGYTAGASYHENFPGSLTLGGYDKSRFSSPNVSFAFGTDMQDDLVVQLDNIWISSEIMYDNSTIAFLSKPVSALINSAVPHMWLPEEACSVIAKELNLTYNERINYYSMNDRTHAYLLSQNRNFTFQISNGKSAALEISVPLRAFVLEYFPENYDMSIYYFPLRQAIDPPNQYILGRAFLQEAYMIVDYEQKKFSLHQAQFRTEKDIVAIRPTTARLQPTSATRDSGESPPPAVHHGNTQKLKLPLSIGISLAVTVLLLVGFFLWKRRKNKKVISEESGVEQTAWQKPEMEGVDARHEAESNPIGPELDAGLRAELYGCEKMPHLLDGMPTPVEMGTDSAIHEASAGSTEDLSEDTRTGVAP